MSWSYIILALGVAWLLQVILSFWQMRDYRATWERLLAHKDGYIGFGAVRQRWGKGAMAFILADREGRVKECWLMEGLSTLARFKKKDLTPGTLPELIERLKGETAPGLRALSIAAQQALARMEDRKVE
ncbi:DNA-binding transcriptional regulator of glucitol operon [Thermanaeromonas toyohensis ToBE]|uniref:DNA-binding transcriptional regulator of glucitol operon n=1 Tax=Thermanaeromonas toyohensis ToBE TaxID=698762 RepID=A0A1W1VP69_9FIRM|nr:transcriptional regulator GutM [Thermanaeromonas toyohensis]SMB95030.1 DNA-binding transcriptional regulator of glucitol operon [Thermanaeromonas toyohensis ToBE]